MIKKKKKAYGIKSKKKIYLLGGGPPHVNWPSSASYDWLAMGDGALDDLCDGGPARNKKEIKL